MISAVPPPTVPSSDACVILAAQQHGVAPDLMLAVRSIERGTPGAGVRNVSDGSYDFNEPGLNTGTITDLAKRGWDPMRLVNDGCYGMAGAAHWMQLKLLDVTRPESSLLERAARYHSKTPHFNARYQGMLAPPMRDWSCHLYHYWKVGAASLFAVASRITNEEELKKCQPKPHMK